MNSTEQHISSFIVQTQPTHILSLLADLDGYPKLEVATKDLDVGKVICVLETETLKQIDETIASLQAKDTVLSVAMVYHHCEAAETLDEDIS